MDPQGLTGLDCEDVDAPGHHVVDVGQPGTLGEGIPADFRNRSRDGSVESIDGLTIGRRDGNSERFAQSDGVGAHLGGFGPLLVGNGDRSSRDHRPL